MRFKLTTLESGIKSILLDIGKDLKVHKLDNDSYVIDIEYDEYTIKIMELFKEYLNYSNKDKTGMENI
jgi:hypothetical protein